MAQRFFVSPDVLKQRPVILSGAQAHQMRRVLRLAPGDPVILLDNSGRAYEATINGYSGGDAILELGRNWQMGGEPRVRITLYQAALKGERFEWVLQKGTELGISSFVPLICARNVVEDRRAIEGKRERWQRILQEAAEQSGRAIVPGLGPPLGLTEAVAGEAGGGPTAAIRLIPWEGERAHGLRSALASCNLMSDSRIQVFVGPEGGLTDEEVALAARHGVRPVSLGPRILRAETAGLVAAAAILYEAGELEPPAA